MGIFNQVLGLIFSLSLLVLIHEFGHFIFARIFKTRVEKFYLFFNPGFSIFRAKRFNGKWHFSVFSKSSPEGWGEHPDSTEWGLGWLPFGGYCAIAGMIDETKSSKDMASEPQPWEYRSKKAWQRLLIITGGVLMNFVLALFLYSCILFTWGQEYIPIKNATMGYDYAPILLDAGFKNGDKIITIDGKEFEKDIDASREIIVNGGGREVTVERGDSLVSFTLPEDLSKKFIADSPKGGIMGIRFPFIVEKCEKGSPAEKAGLQLNDHIVGINDTIQTPTFVSFVLQIADMKETPVTLNVTRDGTPISVQLTTTKDGRIGAYRFDEKEIFVTKKITYSLIESIPAGIKIGINTFASYASSLKLLFNKGGEKQLGGFFTIGSIFPKTWDWEDFWSMTAFLSIILAFMNILPIPALDGGHVFFTLAEMITGRKPGDKFMERAQMVGMILLLGLMVLATYNDIARVFFGR